MASDLKMHPDIDNPALSGLATIGMMYVSDAIRPPCSIGSNDFGERG